MMKKLNLLCFFMLACLTISGQESVLPFDEAYKRIYNISKLELDRPVIDGRLDDDCWKMTGTWSDNFVQVSPYERQTSPSPTRVKLFYDDKYVYVGLYCRDAEPEKMNRFINARDANGTGDLVSIAFDTYHDYRAAPEFNLNLGGNRTDLIVTDKLAVNMSWNAVWEAKTFVDLADSSWTAEMRIPFSQLRYNWKSEDGIWGLHVRRIIRRNNEVQNWSMIPLKNNGHVFSFGEMHGMNNLPKPRSVELLPYVMGKYRSEPAAPNNPYRKGDSFGANFGLDAKFALSDFTLDLTVNPDFGQVELDPSVMNLTAYETFYDEKRPFFLEGKHIFDFGSSTGSDMMFYSRRLGASPSYSPAGVDNVSSFAESKENVPILGALKLTGTNRHGLTVGFMQSLTAQSNARVMRNGTESRETVEPFAGYTVGRIQKNWLGNTLLGAMMTFAKRDLKSLPHLEDIMAGSAFVGGVDFVHYFNNRLYYVDAKAMFSSVSGTANSINILKNSAVHYYPEMNDDPGFWNRTSLSGTGGYVKLGRKGNSKWSFSEMYEWASRGFDLNELGYLKQANYRSNTTAVEFRQTNVWRMFRSNQLSLNQKNQWDYDGAAIANTVGAEWKTMFLNRYELSIGETYDWNYLDTRLLRSYRYFRYGPRFATEATFNTDKAKRLVFTAKYSGNSHVDGHRSYNTFSPSISYRAGNHILLSGQFDYAWNSDDFQYVATLQPHAYSSLYGEVMKVLGSMNQHTYGLTLKLQANITPDISVHFYGSPFTSTASFGDFKIAVDGASKVFEERFRNISPEYKDGEYKVETAYGPTYNNRFRNPNFSFNEFRANVVGRWEFRPGSTIYLVWERRSSQRDANYVSGWGDNLDRMMDLPSTNTIMLKVNYWLNL